MTSPTRDAVRRAALHPLTGMRAGERSLHASGCVLEPARPVDLHRADLLARAVAGGYGPCPACEATYERYLAALSVNSRTAGYLHRRESFLSGAGKNTSPLWGFREVATGGWRTRPTTGVKISLVEREVADLLAQDTTWAKAMRTAVLAHVPAMFGEHLGLAHGPATHVALADSRTDSPETSALLTGTVLAHDARSSLSVYALPAAAARALEQAAAPGVLGVGHAAGDPAVYTLLLQLVSDQSQVPADLSELLETAGAALR